MRELPGLRHPALAARGRHPMARRVLHADPDDRWASVFGRIAGYSFLVALVSGILLLPFFRPGMMPVVYHGSYRKLDGSQRAASPRSANRSPPPAGRSTWLCGGPRAPAL